MARRRKTPLETNPTRVEPLQPKTPVYFWKPHEVPYGIFSQWFEQGFKAPKDDGTEFSFNCAEQYMMYRKALLFKDPVTADLILSDPSPQAQRKLGRLVKGFDDKVWKKNRSDIVEEGNYRKFKEDPSVLLGTQERELVEASPYDKVWGIGFDPAKANEKDRHLWGANLLGKALMATRKRIMEEKIAAKEERKAKKKGKGEQGEGEKEGEGEGEGKKEGEGEAEKEGEVVVMREGEVKKKEEVKKEGKAKR